MKTIDALNILSISEQVINLETVKKFYRQACKTYHPDINPAGKTIMQAINEAYETLKECKFPFEKSEKDKFEDYGELLNEALNKIIHISELNIEICGSWVWVSGETKKYKDVLKETDYIYSAPKEMWYFRPKSQVKRFYRGKRTIDEIRGIYGRQVVRNRYSRAITTHA